MPVFFHKNTAESLDSLRQIIMCGSMEYKIQSSAKKLCKDGTAIGQLTGGNLSVLYSLCGSVSFGETNGKILFLEDLSEHIYHIDRMLQNLKRNGFFANIKGLIIGSFTEMKDGPVPFGKTSEEILFDLCSELNIPVFANFPAGHINDNRSLIMGQTVKMEVTNNSLQLRWQSE